MFRRLLEPVARVTITVDGQAVMAAEGDTVAAALLANGITRFRRSPTSASPRGPFCAMGVCFECLVTIDGEPNRQACLIPVRDGMQVVTGAAAPDLLAERQ
ncbi:MAG TPA: (2Fe-2S)-binding protein [Beijerinckiaceae bacterium]|nr:(2Fe-2S)-binding protein [Beijerinckiaceae bacterium]